MSYTKVVLITGASSGIGLATANYLHHQGYRVFGTKLPQESIPPHVYFDWVDLDVTQDESVQHCIETMMAQTGRIDVLVNNAGAALTGSIEETSLEEARWQMEVNFWGMVKMTKVVLPHMRERRSGRIINMSSLLGLFGTPFSPFYVASKHAVEGFTKSLRYEVATFGIKVAMIEPGFVKTDLLKHGRETAQTLSVYQHMQNKLLETGVENLQQGFDPQIIAETVHQIIESPKPRLQYPLFLDPLSRLTSRLPEPVRERVLHHLMGVYNINQDVPYFLLVGTITVFSMVYLQGWLKRNELP